MARQSCVAQLQSARDTTEQAAALRQIKNGIVGHPLKKELVVSQGVLDPVVRLALRQSHRPDPAAHNHTFAIRPLHEDETIRLQALHILASIAQGGPSFLAPLHDASALPTILTNICPNNNPSQVVLASLRAISNIIASATVDPDVHTTNLAIIADALFTRQHLISLARILSQTSHAPNVQNSINIAASLVGDLCMEERYQHAVASSGVLDALATRIASFIVAEGLVIPGADILARRDELQDYFPHPTPRNANLSVTLQAVSAVISGSKLRACQLLFSPSILAVLPGNHAPDYIAGHINDLSYVAPGTHPGNLGNGHLSALDFLLPNLPVHSHRKSSAQAAAFPSIGGTTIRDHRSANGQSTHVKNSRTAQSSAWIPPSSRANQVTSVDGDNNYGDEESPFIAYLIFILRSRTGLGRLAAASVLAVLYRAGLTSKTRETAIASLVIPLLLELIQIDILAPPLRDDTKGEKLLQQSRTIREKTPTVLAMFITDNEYLQKAAFDNHAIPRLCTMLKMAYDPVEESLIKPPWMPAVSSVNQNGTGQPHLLVNLGLSPLLLHNIKVRESTLRAIAAIVPFKDEYRKVVVDEGLVPYIVESMTTRPGKPAPRDNEKNDKAVDDPAINKSDMAYGINPLPVIIAACGAIRALSRSVSILRTTLIDIGIAPPVITLLHHSDLEVQIAATATMCNLVTDISPMRDTIIEAGVVKILCEHAHSTDVRLRLNALWALKHFVTAVSTDLKRQCIEELGQGWLIQLICDSTEDDLLNLSSEDKGIAISPSISDEDVDMGQFSEQVEAAFSSTTTSRPPISKPIRDAEKLLATLRDLETNPTLKAKTDDIAVQEQGLSLIRNLIGPTGPGASSEVPEMVDYILSSFGQDRIFQILSQKIRSKTINAYSRSRHSPSKNPSSKISTTTISPAPPELILAVTMILVHIAASIPRHRQIVISQSSLLSSLTKQFQNPIMEIRLAMCHLCTNLTWLDDVGDGVNCKERTRELVRFGWLEQLELLERDSELGVRERAKTAVWQMKQGLMYSVAG